MGGSASETRPIICWLRHRLPLTTRSGELLRIDVVHEQQRLRSAIRIADRVDLQDLRVSLRFLGLSDKPSRPLLRHFRFVLL
jgi:hypothetical protein